MRYPETEQMVKLTCPKSEEQTLHHLLSDLGHVNIKKSRRGDPTKEPKKERKEHFMKNGMLNYINC